MPYLEAPALALDLPGRGRRPADLESITCEVWADSAVADIENAGLSDVILVGHSMAGLTLPRVLERIPERLARLMELIDTLPRPLLIHCQSGADRSGLASALFLARAAKATEFQAEWQLSFFYGHVSMPTAKAWPMDRTWEALEPALGYEGS